MGNYMGYIDEVQGPYSVYYNFHPLYEVMHADLRSLTDDDYVEILPESQKRDIQLFYRSSDDANTMEFLEHHAQNKLPVILSFLLDELDDNFKANQERNLTGYKISAESALLAGKLTTPSQFGLYQILTPSELDADFQKDKIITINDCPVYQGDCVLVNIADDFFAGPYEVEYRPYDKRFFVKPELDKKKYVVSGYSVRSLYIFEEWAEIKHTSIQWQLCSLKHDEVAYLDAIDDAELLEAFKETIATSKVKDGNISLSELSSLLSDFENSLLIAKDIPSKIKKQRLARMVELFTSAEGLADNLEYISSEFCDLLVAHKDTQNVNDLLKKLTETSDFYERLRDTRQIQERIEACAQSLHDVQEEVRLAEDRLASVQQQTSSVEEAVLQEQLEQLNQMSEDYKRKTAELQALNEQLGLVHEYADIHEKNNQLKRDVAYEEESLRRLKEKTDQAISAQMAAEDQFSAQVNRYHDRMVSIAFDGFVSNKMITAAAQWEKEDNAAICTNAVEAISRIPTTEKTPEELISHLCDLVQTVRPEYKKNTILNLMICASQGFLTVLSGEPGCGKTSICSILANALGLNAVDALAKAGHSTALECGRYVPVSVERGWTSKRDFIGYFNPLSKTFDTSNRRVYDMLQILNKEAELQLTPFPALILLDEANLSPMEYYWADFMNLCDDLDDNSQINLGGDYLFKIPETLHFLATINNDHTTEVLSPRLIDRAWIVTLPKQSESDTRQQKNSGRNRKMPADQIVPISWTQLKELFVVSEIEEKPSDVARAYKAVLDMMRSARIPISYRIEQSIESYWAVARKWLEQDEYRSSPDIIALDYAVAQRILPKLSGHGEPFKKHLVEFQQLCNQHSLNKSAELIGDIIQRGEMQMNYYQFF